MLTVRVRDMDVKERDCGNEFAATEKRGKQ
jgi:hypothetical protein